MRKYYLGVLLMVGFLSIPACEKADPGNNPETPVEKEPAATDDIHGAGDGDSEEVLPPASPEYDDILCGNGKLDPGESCDDGGRLPHDGCNIYCQIERGYDCNTAEPSVCGKICGNGKIDSGEECDDGNTENHDGCDNRCKFEEKFDCSTDSEPTKCYAKEYFGLGTCTNPIYFNGNNLILSGQNFNDAFTDSVAFCADKIDPLQADAVIKTELKKGQMLLISDAAGSNLSFFIIPGYCETASTCLNVKVNQENQYNYYYATQDEIVTAIFSSNTLVDTPYELHIEKVTPVCGDGQFIPLAEECDDGNTDNGDGCDNKCQIEETYICNNENWDGFKRNVSTCTTRCGNNSFDYRLPLKINLLSLIYK